VQTNPTSPEAKLGTAVHEALASMIDRLVPYEDVLALAPPNDIDEFERLYWAGVRAWEQLRQWFPDPECEFELSAERVGLSLTGHADVLSSDKTEARVIDWKTGYRQSDYREQLRGYAWCLTSGNPLYFERARVWTVWLREGVADVEVFERADLERWAADLAVRLNLPAAAVTYNPSAENCRYCPRALTCPARRALLRQIAVDADNYEDTWHVHPGWTGDDLHAARERCKMLRDECEAIEAQIKVEVGLRGGSAPLADGRELRLRREERRKIKATEKSTAILAQHIRTEDLFDCYTIGKTVVEAAVKANAPRGQKGSAVKELFDRLDAAGAIETTFIEKLEIRKAVTHADATAAIPAGQATIAGPVPE
jgi:hypothetical protein